MLEDLKHPLNQEINEGTRDKILRVTRELIARRGVQGASLAAISKEAGISRGTLFYYFPSKQSLLYQVMEDSFQEITEKILQAIGNMHTGIIADDVLKLTLQYIGESRSLNQTNFHLFQEAIVKDAALQKRFQESYRQWQGMIAEHLEKYFPESAARYNPQTLGSLILALIDGISIQTLLDYAPVDYGETSRILAGLFEADEQKGKN